MNERKRIRSLGRTRRAGFTLSEIMIALGVIVVGLGMAAGAFHAGIRNHKTTIDDIMKSMVGENAMAIARLRLTEDIDLGREPRVLDLKSGEMGKYDTWYPVPSSQGVLPVIGYLLVGSRPEQDKNDFRFTIIPFMLTGTADATDINVETSVVPNVTIADYYPRGSSRSDPPQQSTLTLDRRGGVRSLEVGSKLMHFDKDRGAVTVATVSEFMRRYYIIEPALPRGRMDLYNMKVTGSNVENVIIEPLDPYPGRTPLPVARDPNHG